MSQKKSIPLVLTLITETEKSYNLKKIKILEIFRKYQLQIASSKKLSKYVKDFFLFAKKLII